MVQRAMQNVKHAGGVQVERLKYEGRHDKLHEVEQKQVFVAPVLMSHPCLPCTPALTSLPCPTFVYLIPTFEM